MKKYLVAPFTEKRFKGGITHLANLLVEEFSDFEVINTLVVEGGDDTKGKLKWVNIKSSMVLMASLWKVERSSLIHFHTSISIAFLKDMIVCLPILLFKDVKLVWHIHFAVYKDVFSYEGKIKFFYKWFLKKCAVVVCLGKNFEKEIIENFGLQNTAYLMNPSTIDFVCKEKDKQGPLQFVFMGSPDARKGIIDLMKAVANLKKEEAELHIYGAPLEPQIVAEFNNLVEKNDNIVYHGYISGQERVEAICKSDFLVLPSKGEGLPLVIVEYLSCGKPVIVTDVGANQDVVHNGKNGILFKYNEPQDLAKALKSANGWMTEERRQRLFQERGLYHKSSFFAKLNEIYKRASIE